MKRSQTIPYGIFLLFLLGSAILLPSFQCEREPFDDCQGPYTAKYLAVPVATTATTTSFTLGDTVRFSSAVSDTLQSLDSTERFKLSIEGLMLRVEIFVVIPPTTAVGTPVLQPVYADFNPLVFDGILNTGSPQYIQYRRAGSRNYLSFGLLSRVRGTYLLRFTPNPYPTDRERLYPCTSFGLEGRYEGSQNPIPFITYGVTTLSSPPAYGYVVPVNRSDKNYVIVTIN